jgi:pyruvate-formate lyase-activating enzyme
VAASTTHRQPDAYGHARLPASAHDTAPERIDKIPYGRFRNVYLYITEACQLRCEHCYMGERLERALKMPFSEIVKILTTWRQMGGSKLTILGGEPTLHPRFSDAIRYATAVGYEHVITTSNGLDPAMRKFRRMTPDDFAYIQISLDGGSPDSHDQVRGDGTFDQTVRNVAELVERGFDIRIICTVNRVNVGDCLNLLDIADEIGVGYATDGYRGCIGRTLDRISIFPDGRAYVCSFLFDTDLHFANMVDGQIVLNQGDNEFDLFTQVLKGQLRRLQGSERLPGRLPRRRDRHGLGLLRDRA